MLLSHRDAGNDKLAELKGKPILVSTVGRQTYWLWLKAKYGFTDDQIAPIHVHAWRRSWSTTTLSMEGFLTDEPFEAKQADVDAVVHNLADNGYLSYSNVIVASPKMVAENPQAHPEVRRCDCQGLGRAILHGDPTPANNTIKSGNNQMTDDADRVRAQRPCSRRRSLSRATSRRAASAR